LALTDGIAFLLAPALNAYNTNPSDHQAVHFIRHRLLAAYQIRGSCQKKGAKGLNTSWKQPYKKCTGVLFLFERAIWPEIPREGARERARERISPLHSMWLILKN
jgi:hypothetical protein